jgi:ketosteroid isomerase-like protein
VKHAIFGGLIVSVLLSAGAAVGQTNQELAAQVRAAELAFAGSMAKRDLQSFASHVADEAVFYGTKDVFKGKSAVVAGWKRYFEGPSAPFSWEPATVDVLESGTLAYSSGPVRDPEGKQIGTFNSIWRRDADGRWRVIFDKGCP